LTATPKSGAGKWGFEIPGHPDYLKVQDDAWTKEFTPEGQQRMYNYTDGYYSEYNAAMWLAGPGTIPKSTGDTVTAYQKDYDNAVALAKEMIDKAPTLPTGTMLHRGVELSDALLKQLLASAGTVVQETGFASTRITEGKGYASSANVQWRLKCAPGVKGMWAGTHGANKTEVEFVLPPNSRYLITGYEKKHGQYFVDAILLPTLPDQCC
jgi:hypothetical protein